MTLDNILNSLFPNGHEVRNNNGLLLGSGLLQAGSHVAVIGVANRTPVGVDEAIRLSGWVLDAVERGGDGPDSGLGGQRQPADEQARRAAGIE